MQENKLASIVTACLRRFENAKCEYNWFVAEKMLNTIIFLTQFFVKTKFQSNEFQWQQMHNIQVFLRHIIFNNTNIFKGKWIREKLACLVNKFSLGFKKSESIIYILFNTQTKDMYVGETQDLKKRFEDEIRKGRECSTTYSRKNRKKLHNFTHAEKTMARIGWEKFIFVPVKNLGHIKHNAKQIRLRFERLYINKINPSMNTRATQNPQEKFQTRKSKRRRPLMKFRNKGEQKHKGLKNLTATTYRVTNLTKFETATTNVLDLTLKTLKEGHYYTIQTIKKGITLTNWKILENDYGENKVSGAGIYLQNYIAAMRKNKIKRINIKISHQTALANAQNFFERIAKHKYHKQRTLKKLDSKALLEIWANAQVLPSDDTRKIVNQNLSHYIKKKLNLHAIRNPCIKIPYDNNIDMKQIRHIAEEMFNQTNYGERIKGYVRKKLRVISLNNRTLKQWLTNSKYWTAAKNFPCLGQPYCTKEQHLQKNLSELEGLPKNITAVNTNYIPHDSRSFSYETVTLCLINWCTQILSIDSKMSYKKNQSPQIISIFDEDGNRIRQVTVPRMKKLFNQYEGNNFVHDLVKTAKNYRNHNNKSIPTKLQAIMMKYFHLRAEYKSSPFDVSDSTEVYYSKYNSDFIFGSQGNTDLDWPISGFVNPDHTNDDIKKACLKAIHSATSSNTTIVLAIPILESQNYMELTKNPAMHKIIEWQPNTFKFSSSLDNSLSDYSPWAIAFFVVSNNTKVDVDYKIWNEMLTFSRNFLKTEPYFYPNKFNNKPYVRLARILPRPNNKNFNFSLYLEHLLTILKIPSNSKNKILGLIRFCRKDKFKEKKEGKIYIKDIIKARRVIPRNSVVSVKDKNQGQMWIECPAAFKKRIDKEISNCNSLTITKETAPQIIQNLKQEYDANNLKKFGRWRNGSLPYMYIIPKDKDPYNKSRLIASYYDHPLKYVYKNTSKVITWCFKREKAKHFTLSKITDIMSKTKDAARWRIKQSLPYKLTSNKCTQTSTMGALKTQLIGFSTRF